MSIQTTEKTVSGLDVLVKYDDGSEQALIIAEQETARALEKSLKGLSVPELISEKQACLMRGVAADRVRQLYERASFSKDVIRRAFSLWAVNYRRLGEIIKALLDMGKSLRTACKELEIKDYEGRKCVQLAQLTAEELQQKIEAFEPERNFSQDAFLRSLGIRPQAEPRPAASGGNGGSRTLACPELKALNELLDWIYQNPQYFLTRGYAEEPSFLQRVQASEMRERYRAGLSVLLQVLSK